MMLWAPPAAPLLSGFILIDVHAVHGVDARTPTKKLLTPLVYLFFRALARQVVLLEGIFVEVEELVGLVAIVVCTSRNLLGLPCTYRG